MRNVYVSPGFALVGAVIGAAIALVPVVVPWPPYGPLIDVEAVFLVPQGWAAALGVGGAAVGAVAGALAGRSIVDAGVGLFERVTRWLPWWW